MPAISTRGKPCTGKPCASLAAGSTSRMAPWCRPVGSSTAPRARPAASRNATWPRVVGRLRTRHSMTPGTLPASNRSTTLKPTASCRTGRSITWRWSSGGSIAFGIRTLAPTRYARPRRCAVTCGWPFRAGLLPAVVNNQLAFCFSPCAQHKLPLLTPSGAREKTVLEIGLTTLRPCTRFPQPANRAFSAHRHPEVP